MGQSELFGAHSNYFLGRNMDDRERLAFQFELLREDFNLWFDEALAVAGLAADPDVARWSVLDVGCGHGQYAREIARRYPGATVIGIDADPEAIAAALAGGRQGKDDSKVQFAVHDVRQPIDGAMVPAGGFDVVVAWLVLMYLPGKPAALANLAAVSAPGGMLMLGNVADDPMRLDHPAAEPFMAAGRLLSRRLGLTGLEHDIEPLLRQSGFTDVSTVVLRYPIGGGTASERRWLAHALASMSGGRHLVVDVSQLMDGTEYDKRLEEVRGTPALDHSGESRFLVTLAGRVGKKG